MMYGCLKMALGFSDRLHGIFEFRSDLSSFSYSSALDEIEGESDGAI